MPTPPASPTMLPPSFFDRDACAVARTLIGVVLRRRWRGRLLAAMIVEAEAYYARERGSHSSLGRTPSREPMFMAPGTIYMYYARGGDSLNFSCRGPGNAVLIKAAVPHVDQLSPGASVEAMQRLNPRRDGGPRPVRRLCAGQTLLCRALALKVPRWSGRPLDPGRFYLDDVGLRPGRLIQTRRLGIPAGRDEQLMYRFIDAERAGSCTANPLTRRSYREGIDYRLVSRAGRRLA